MKTFNDIKEGDRVYTISGNDKQIYPFFVTRIDDNGDIFVKISNCDDIYFVAPKSNDTYYCGVYSCIEAIIKYLEDEI